MRRAPFFVLVAVALVTLLAARVAARSTWIPRIPNRSPTNLIPNADGSAMCVRVGHVGCSGMPSPGGGNDFGRAFVNGGSHWTMQLCLADSDGDGKTNGDELGDVCCTWVENSGVQARVTTHIAHPGFAQSTTSRPSCVHGTPALTTAPTVGDVTATTIAVSWGALSYTTSCWCGWKVQASSDGGTSWVDVGQTRSHDTTTATLTGLHPGASYSVRVVPTAMSVDGSERLGTASPVVEAATVAKPCSDNDSEAPCHTDGCVWCANTQYCQEQHSTCPVCSAQNAPNDCTGAHCQWCDNTASCHDVNDECANCTMLSGNEQQCNGAGCTYCADSDMCVNHGDSCECTPLEGTCGADGCGGSLGTCGDNERCTHERECACDTAHDYFGEPGHCTHCTPAGTCSGHGECTASGQCKCDLQWAGDEHCSSCSDGVSGVDCSTVSYVAHTLIDASYDFYASSMVSTDRSAAAHGEHIAFFRLESTAPGYMAIGISPDGTMTDNGHGADVIAAFIDADGHPHVYDYSSRAHAPVPLDAEQNVQLMGGERVGDDRMVVEFARHLTTQDTTDDRAFTINTNHLIYAGGSTAPPASGVFGHPQYHDLGHGQWTTELDMGPCDPAVHCNGRGECLPTGGCECDAPWMTVPGGYGCTEVNYAAVVEMKASYGYRLSMVTAPAAVDDEDQSPIVYMRIQTTEPTAWVALGISLDGTMDSSGAGSDIIVAFVDAENKPHVYDYWAPTAAAPLLDDDQNVHMWRGSPTTFEFYRRANTSDPFDRVIHAGEDNTFIYAARKFSTDALPPANGDFAHVPPHNMDKGAASVRMFVGMCNVAECVHGECSNGEGCVCARGWGGPFCNTQIACNAATTCHGHGTCTADNTCACDAGYSGVDCSVFGSSFSNADGTWRVQWAFAADHKDVTFTITARTGGWSAIGFNNKPLMKGADMVVAWVDGDNTLRVSDRHSGGHAVPSVDAQDDVQHASGTQKGSGSSTETTWTFTRALDTNDNDDVVIPNSVHGYGEFYLLWAYGSHDGTGGADGSFAKHTARKAVKMNLMSGTAKSVSLTDYVTPHAVLMVIGWGVCVFVGAFIARFYKHIGHRWYQLHVSLQSFGVLIAIVAFALGVKSVDRGGEHFTKTHHKIGLALMVIGVLQGFLGYLANKMWNPDRKGVPFFPDRLHWILGYVCMALAPAAIFTGMELRGNVAMGLVVVYAAWLGAFVAIYAYKSILATFQGKSLAHDPSMYAEMGDSGNLPALSK